MVIGLSTSPTSFSPASFPCRVSREHSTTRRFINYLSNEAKRNKEQLLMQMRLCTTIITNIMWFRHVFAGRPGARGPLSMLAGLWQHKLRVIWWLIKWQSNTRMNYEIAAWMGFVSSPRWMEMKEVECNFFSSITQFRAPPHKSQFIQLLFMKTKFRAEIAIVPFHFEFRSLTLIQFAPQFCSALRPREWKWLLISMRSENNFVSPYGHDGMTQQQRVKCDKHAMWFERTTLPTCCCLFRAVFLCGGT